MRAPMMIIEETPDPKEAQLNCKRELESLDWSMMQLLLVCLWEVDWAAAGWGLEPPPPVMELKPHLLPGKTNVKVKQNCPEH